MSNSLTRSGFLRGSVALGAALLPLDAAARGEELFEVTDAETARKILRVMEALEDNDDVQDVYANFDIDESLMQAVG